jgi:hypothetical protein
LLGKRKTHSHGQPVNLHDRLNEKKRSVAMATIRPSRVYQQQMAYVDGLIKTVNTLSWAHYSNFERENHTKSFDLSRIKWNVTFSLARSSLVKTDAMF